MQLVAAVVRQSAGQVADVLGDIVPGILRAVQRDDDELREGCLQVRSSHSASNYKFDEAFRRWRLCY